jgi:hypothetical protein
MGLVGGPVKTEVTNKISWPRYPLPTAYTPVTKKIKQKIEDGKNWKKTRTYTVAVEKQGGHKEKEDVYRQMVANQSAIHMTSRSLAHAFTTSRRGGEVGKEVKVSYFRGREAK